MAQAKNQRPKTLSEEALAGLYEAEHRPSHDQKWAELEADDAPLARQALVAAQTIREQGGEDPGDAYLRGVADTHAWDNRQRLIDEARATIDALPEATDRSQ